MSILPATLRAPFRHSVALFLLSLCWLAGHAVAQSTYGTLTGTVSDSTGAVVPGATVRVVNEATAAERATTADANGDYRVINLDAGNYTVTVTAANFGIFKDEHVVLPARETIRADVHLPLKSVSQETTVTANEDVVPQELTLSNTLSGTEINSLPLNFRATASPSPINVAVLTPSVNLDQNNNLTFAGQLPSATSFSLDGISIQGVRAGGPTRDLFPSVEDIDEFRVNTASGSAEYAQPTDLTVTTRGGTNKFHGSAYWFAQRKGWDSSDQIAKEYLGANGNDYGVAVSGPIWKNHTFFWFDYETDRLGQNTLIDTQTYPAAWTSGNFGGVTNSTTAGAPPFQLYIPGTTIPIPGNNLAAIGGVNATTAKILPLFFPTPAGPSSGDANIDNTGANNLQEVFPGQYTLNGYDGRIDHTFNSRHSIFGRITDKQITSTGTDAIGDSTYNPLMGTFSNISDLVNLAVSYNWIISPVLVNELRGGFTNANFISSYPQAAMGNSDITNFGIQGTPGPPKNGLNGVPVFYVGNLLGGVTDNDGHPSITKNSIFEVGDNLSWTHGKFNSKFGVDFRRLFYTANIDFIDGDEYGDYHASGALGFCPLQGEIAAYPDACGAAQFDTGYLDYATQAQNGPDGKPYDFHYDFFGQTEYKVNNRLSLTVGLRYELNTPFIDQTNQLGNFLTNVPGGGLLYNKGENINPLWAEAVGNTPFIQNGTNGYNYPAGLRFLDKSNIQPRVGFAYNPIAGNDAVIKASVGQYSVPVLGAVLYSLLGIDTSYYGIYASSATDPLNWSNVFAATPGVGSDPGYRRANQFDLKDPRVTQWNFAYEQSIGKKTLGRATYIGSHTYDLIYSPDLNQVAPNTTGLATGTAAIAGLTAAQRAALLKYPNFNEVLTRANGPSDKYNALILEGNRRFSQGLSFTTAYTLTSNKTNALGTAPNSAIPAGGSGAGDNGNNVQDIYDIHMDYGNAFYDPRHKLLATAVYDLPFGKGREFANNLNSAANFFVGGWSTTGIFLFHTGNFLTPYFPSTVADPSGTNPSERSVAQQRPDCTGSGTLGNPTIKQFFNPAAFTIPGNNIGRFGNCGVGILQGPKTTTLSMSAGKNFDIHEGFQLRYEAQFSNLFNITNWANPNMNVSSTAFGAITSSAPFQNGQLSGPRTIQMSLRLKY
jgi:hypothetical protein